MGLFDAAKEFVTNPDNIRRAKELATDANIEAAADKLKEFAPKQAGLIDGAAEKAKEWGGPEDEAAAPREVAEAGDGQNDDGAGSERKGEAAN